MFKWGRFVAIKMEETKKNEQLAFEAKVIKTLEGGSILAFFVLIDSFDFNA